jgi:hypothetical protein
MTHTQLTSPQFQDTLQSGFGNKKKSSGLIHTIKGLFGGPPMDEDNDSGLLTPDRPSPPMCYHPNHTDTVAMRSHLCALVDTENILVEELYPEPEFQGG